MHWIHVPIQNRHPRSAVACWGVGILLGCLAAAVPAHASSSQSNTTNVSANVEEAIEVVEWPTASFTISSAAVPGQAVVSGALGFTVRANTSWGIQIRSDDADGKLREFNTGTAEFVTGGRTMKRALEWGLSSGGPWNLVRGAATTMVSEQPATGESGAAVAFFVRLQPSFDDIRLGPGREYRITLIYTVGVGY